MSVARLLASLAFVALGAAAVPASALATHRKQPPPIILTTKADTQRAAQESYCVLSPAHDGESSGVGVCRASNDQRPRRLSIVRPREVVTISFRGAAFITDGSASVRVLGTQRSIRRFTLDRPATRWRVRLRPGKYEIQVFGRFGTADGRSGDTSGSLGLHVRRAQPPPLAGRSLAR